MLKTSKGLCRGTQMYLIWNSPNLVKGSSGQAYYNILSAIRSSTGNKNDAGFSSGSMKHPNFHKKDKYVKLCHASQLLLESFERNLDLAEDLDLGLGFLVVETRICLDKSLDDCIK